MPRGTVKEAASRLAAVRHALASAYGHQKCFLDSDSPFQLLVAAVLSAQCTDARVNKTTPALFAKYPDPLSMSQARLADIERLIRPTGFFRAKASSIRKASRMIMSDFAGEVPSSMEGLCSLPGVGRKTANVLLGHAFGVPGFPADTHVVRLMNRMGFVNTDSPEKIESFVNAALPAKYWIEFSQLLISHGRSVCRARSPRCESCMFEKTCPKKGVARRAGRRK